jgi:DNA recombination protein RmuC
MPRRSLQPVAKPIPADRPAPPPPPPAPPVVRADTPPAFDLPPRHAVPSAEAQAAPAPVPPGTAPAPDATNPVPPATETSVGAPAKALPFHLPDLAIAGALGALVLLGALAALFAWLAWRRSALSNEMVRASAEFTRSSVSVLANEVQHTERAIRDETARMRDEADARGRNLRGEVREQIGAVGGRLSDGMEGTRGAVEGRMDAFARSQTEAAERLRSEVRLAVAGFGETLKLDIAALTDSLGRSQLAFQAVTREALVGVEQRVGALTDANEQRQKQLRETVEQRLDDLRRSNDAKLEQMRATVEEKLQGTLERRLGESFALVSERLENVHRGLGEMQALATGVGDLKRVLTNVKTRGGWAEVQLGTLLASILSPDQFASNVEVRPGSGERVEFSVLLPGDGADKMHLPIDAKFPLEDYERLVKAQEENDPVAVELAARGIEMAIRREAQRIASKYICPPYSTEYAFLYLPSEGLYAEAARRPGLMAEAQQRHRIVIAGPSTLAAMVNALQMGFRALAIQKRSGEVWRVLGEAKAEFEKYGGVWDRLKKQLETVQRTVDDAGVRTRAVTRRLREVGTDIDGAAPFALEAEDEEDEAGGEGEA